MLISFFSDFHTNTKMPSESEQFMYSSGSLRQESEWPNFCQFCETSFVSRIYYQQHMSQNHMDKLPYSCETCQKGFFTKSGLYKHMSDHAGRQFSCPICDQRFKRKYHLQKHIKGRHKLFPCPNCSQTFSSNTDYSGHVLQCSRNQMKLD